MAAAKKKPAAAKPAAKKASASKPPAPKQPQPKSLKASGVSVNKKSQAGDLGSERSVMREAAQRNQTIRERDKKAGNPGVGLINVTYRGNDGKLKNSVLNRRMDRKTELGKTNYYFIGDSTKNKKKK
jgi:hypothetical protein